MKYLPVSIIIDEVVSFIDFKGMVDRPAMKKWSDAIIRQLETPTEYEHKIVLLKVENYRAVAPDDVECILQVAFRAEDKRKVKRVEIVEWTQKMYDGSGCELIISKECPKCHKETKSCECGAPEIIYDVDRLWELSHPEFRYGHMKHYYRHGGLGADNVVTSPYHPEFRLIKKTSHDFFNADLHVPGCLNLNEKLLVNCNIEYKYDHPSITLNCESGEILLAYLTPKTKDGYRMIPDDIDVIDAIKWYIIEALSYRALGKAVDAEERQKYQYLYRDAKINKVEAMGRAYETLNTPSFQDWICFLEQNYYKVFTDQGMPEQMGVRTPDTYNSTMKRLTSHQG